MLDFNVGDFDTPTFSLFIQQDLDTTVESVPLGQHLIEFMLTKYRSQSGLRELAGGFEKVLHINNRSLGIDYPEVDNGAHFHRYVVPGYHVLCRHVVHDRPQVHLNDLLHAWNNNDQSGTFDFLEPAQEEDHASFIFAEDPEGIEAKPDQ